ncbi:MAG: hypothetical protein LBJ76_04265 [Candidatus Accumulibacter sp.]|nr:hypothetical protein [Accumulibacter sp.]
MKDNALFILIRKELIRGLAARGIAGVSVRQNFQPVQQGRATESCVYMTKISDRRHGSLGIHTIYDTEIEEIARRETQVIESAFQFTGLASERNPADDEELTAADILKTAAAVMQGEDFRRALLSSGVQVLRIQEIRNPTMVNERDRFEFQPSFDVVFTHNDEFIARDPVVDRFDWKIKRV